MGTIVDTSKNREMMASVNGPVSMYKLQSYYSDSENIALPSCIYKLNSFYTDSEEQTGGEMTKELVELEQRQEKILQRLAALSQQVDALSKGGIPAALPAASRQAAAHGRSTVSGSSVDVPGKAGIPTDLVIYADPCSPPLSLLVLSQLLADKYKVLHTVHTHSSSGTVPPALNQAFSQAGDVRPRSQYDFIITVIWKAVQHGPCLLLSPSRHSMIEGEACIGRYLARLLSPAYDDDISTATEIDSWLDLSYKLINGNKKEKMAILKSMNTSLGKARWLSGGELSLADIVLWSLIRQSRDLGSPPSNVSNWIKNCNNHPKFEAALKAL